MLFRSSRAPIPFHRDSAKATTPPPAAPLRHVGLYVYRTPFLETFVTWPPSALEETENDRKEDKEAGPRNEIEYWRQRMRKLTGISE